MIKAKDELLKAVETFSNSWGGDAPPEIYWGLSELLSYIEKQYKITITTQLDEDDMTTLDSLYSELESKL